MNVKSLNTIDLSYYSAILKLAELSYSKEKSEAYLNAQKYSQEDLEECLHMIFFQIENPTYGEQNALTRNDFIDILSIVSEKVIEIYYEKMFFDNAYAIKLANLCENIGTYQDTINILFLEAKANYILGKNHEVENSFSCIKNYYPDFDFSDSWNNFLYKVEKSKKSTNIEKTTETTKQNTDEIIGKINYLGSYPYAIQTLKSFLDNNEYSLFKKLVKGDQFDCEQLELMFAHIICEVQKMENTIHQSDQLFLLKDFGIIIAKYLAKTYFYEGKYNEAFKICESSELIYKDPNLMEITAKIYAQSGDLETAKLIFDELSQFFPSYKKSISENENFLLETEFELSEQELKKQQNEIEILIQKILYKIYSKHF